MPGSKEKLCRQKKACADCWTKLTFWKTDVKFCVNVKHLWVFFSIQENTT